MQYAAMSLFYRGEHLGWDCRRPFRRPAPGWPLLPLRPLQKVMLESRVQVPRPLSHDHDSAILISSYLGDMQPLSTLFTSVCRGNTDRALHQPIQNVVNSLMASDRSCEAFFTSIGRRFGRFLAKLHDPRIAKQLLESEAPPFLGHFESRQLSIRRYRRDIQQMRDRLQYWPSFFTYSNELNTICEILEAEAGQQHVPDE